MSDSENEIDPIRNGEMLKTILQPKRIVKRRRGKRIPKQSPRNNGQTIRLPYSLICLKQTLDYSKRDLKEIAYAEIATSLDTNITSIKAKINSLRTQLGREMAKEKSTKSG